MAIDTNQPVVSQGVYATVVPVLLRRTYPKIRLHKGEYPSWCAQWLPLRFAGLWAEDPPVPSSVVLSDGYRYEPAGGSVGGLRDGGAGFVPVNIFEDET